jgi:hypothetical protein
MVSKNTIVKALPPFRNEKILIKQRQGTNDIINEIINTHNEYETDYDTIWQYFDTGDLKTTCKEIWDFLKYNLVYDAEAGEDQSVKSPAAILHPGEKVDCKHYALFAAGVLDAIIQNGGYQENQNWRWFYRFASDKNDGSIGHVFVVATEPTRGQTKEYFIDPVLSNFNQHKQWTRTQDEHIMALYKISGVNNPSPVTVEVDTQKAITSFLTMVNLDLFSLKELLLSDMSVFNGPVKNYFLQKGFNFDTLVNILNNG